MGCGCGCSGAKRGCQGEGSQGFERAKQVAASLRSWYGGRTGIISIRPRWVRGTNEFVVVVTHCSEDAVREMPHEVQGTHVVCRYVEPISFAVTNGIRR